jgi:DNA polymerase-3 subunit epsilon
VVARLKSLIRTVPSRFSFSRLHGITAIDSQNGASFRDVWTNALPLVHGAAFIATHHVGFDLRVLHAQCASAGIDTPRVRFVCTRLLAAVLCGPRNARLDLACAHLGIALRHHDALSDAEASASIVLAAFRDGIALPGLAPARMRLTHDG